MLITPDRGLCGGLVSNINRIASRFILERRQQGQTVEVLTVGRKGRSFAVRTGLPLVAEVTGLGDAPGLTRYPADCDQRDQWIRRWSIRRSTGGVYVVREHVDTTGEDGTAAAA